MPENPESANRAFGCAIAFIGLVALGIFSVICFFAVGGLIEIHKQSGLMARAVPVEATIMSSDVRRETFRSSSSSGGSHTSTTSIVYLPDVTYSYAFGGATHQSDDVYTFPRNGSEPWARRVADQFPPGTTVTASADPAHPERAFLIRAWVPDPYYLVYTGAGCFAILVSMGVLATFFFPRVSRRIAMIGAPIGFVVIAYASFHYWIHVGFAAAAPDWIGLGALATPLLPLGAVLLANGWRRKFSAAAKGARAGADGPTGGFDAQA